MSNFTCKICDRINEDSKEGYVSGCKHHPPEKSGKYRCYVKSYNNVGVPTSTYITVIYMQHEWIIPESAEILGWSKIYD